jgi:hypothetical protein
VKKIYITTSVLALLLAASLLALSCGSSSQNQSQLQTVSISPSTADAQNYPNGEVGFVATGYFVNPDHTITPLNTAWWTACSSSGGGPTNDVILSQSGTAQCGSGAKGTYTIYATAPKSGGACPNITPCGAVVGGCVVNGTAQLTCP